ncbi:MAG: DUF3857 domain-containing protein, partial [Fulvivirga sp.]|nr:DUF3857 domain-containing protein [Fulvivirga sp.]
MLCRFSALFYLLLGTYALYAQNFEITDVPSWVEPVEGIQKSKVSKYDVNDGFYTALYDYQVNIAEESDFTHYALNVLTHGGVSNASQLYISYDTSYQELQFHYLYIWRNGKKINKTQELSFEILKNEQNLHNGIYTGLITAYDILEDVRKDDRIEYAYTLIGDNPIYDGNSFRLVPLEDTNPIDHYYFRILYPKDKAFYSKCEGCDESKLKISQGGNYEAMIYESKHLPAADFEKTMPSWYIPFDYLVFSSFDNWQDVNNWALNIFDLNKKPDLSSAFEEVFTGEESKEEQINALIDFVQDDIRYMGIESGIGSIKPFAPEQVLSQRFGDCKDKSLLLVSLLKDIGVEKSYPVLVNTTLQHGIDNLLPSGQLFDHCIVYFEYKGKGYWVDPTIAQQGGNFKTIGTHDLGSALIVKESTKKLTPMEIEDNISRTEVNEELILTSFDQPGKLKVVTKVYGLNADYLRSVLEYYSIKELSEQYRNMYALVFPDIRELDKMTVEDNLEDNVLTTVEFYEVNNLWKEEELNLFKKQSFQYEPVTLYNYVSPVNCETKESPVQINYPSHFKQTTVIVLPEKLNIPSKKTTADKTSFSFSKNMEQKGEKVLQIDYEYRALKKEIAPDYY